MANYGIRVALAGNDALTGDDKDLVFSSKYNTLKIVDSGVATTSGGTVTIPHNLGFAPTFFVFRKGTADWQKENTADIDSSTYANAYFPNPGNYHTWIDNHENSLAYTDNANLYITKSAGGDASFGYYIFADLAEEYDGTTPKGTNDYGIRIATPNNDALEQKEFQLGFSSRFRALNYNHAKSGSITLNLPAIFGSQVTDPDPEEAIYAEITHGLGYPPFFLAYAVLPSSTIAYELPLATKSPFLDLGYDYVEQIADSWCDATRIRLTWWRKAYYDPGDSWSAGTITLKYLIFNEDLSALT